MSEQSTQLQLPFLAAGQAQKHVTVNESLLRLDALVQLAAASASTSAEPGAPSDGDAYILPAGKTGAHWGAMSDHALAYYRDGAWEEIAPREGWRAFVKDARRMLRHEGGLWRASDGWRVLAHSGVAAAHTGDTAETALRTIHVPAGAMGPNGAVRIFALFSWTPSAHNKQLRIRFGGLSGQVYLNTTVNTNASLSWIGLIANRGAANVQVGVPTLAGGVGQSGGAANTSAADTASTFDIVLARLLSNAGDTVRVECFAVEALYGA